MISIFTTIQADLSPEFRQKCSNSVIDTESLLQKIGEVTGAVLVTDGETPKFVGSWNSVKNTYDILSGFLLYRSLLGVDKRGEINRDENKRSVETFRYINSVYEREKQQLYHPERTNNTQDNLYRSHNAVDLTSEHLDENVHSRMTDKGQDYSATQVTGNYEGDCMDIEKLSAFYQEESQNSGPKHFTESTVKIPNSSYIQRLSIPIVNSPAQNSQSSKNEGTGAVKSINYSISRKKTVARMYNEIVHCDECTYQSYSKRNLLFHKARTHIRPYKCKHCGRGFGLMKDLRRHYQKKRDCKQYTFVRYRQVGDKTVEERINVENFGINENNYDTESNQNVSFENQQISEEAMSSDRHIDDTMATEVDNSTNGSSGRGDTVSILPLDDTQRMSSTDIENEDEGQTSQVMIKNNEMYIKKRSDDEDENTFIVHINKNDSENGDNEIEDYCVVKINKDMDEGDNEATESSSKTDLSESEHGACTSQDSQNCDSNNVLSEKCDKVMFKSEVKDTSHDTAVVDLSQFSLDGDDSSETQAHLDSPSTSFKTGKHHRKHVQVKKKLPYIVMQSEMPKESELKMTFPCSYCDYSTHRLKLIEDHVKRVHFKKFECSQCGTRFGLKKDLNRHYRRTHKMDLELQRRGRRPFDNLDDSEMVDEQEDGSGESVSFVPETDIQT